jgi:hypothetical protein
MSESETETRSTEDAKNEKPAGERERETSAGDDLGLDERQARAFEELRRENAARRRAERAAQAANDELRKELEKTRVENESEQEKHVREAVATAVAETSASFERRLLEAEVARYAAGRLRDPDDAVVLLPLDELLAITDEDVRHKRVDDALSELLESKPYLAAEEVPARETRSTLVTQGGRSAQPNSRKDAQDADSWIRQRARR